MLETRQSLDQLPLFQHELLTWFHRHQRDLPWRRTRNPYAILLSEIMLQQTRVAAVIPYFERFLNRFPTIESLAAAAESDLLSHWAGLGYYYRARNLQKTAQAITQAGVFPQAYDALLNLPGIGEYTAAAVSSIAFNQPHAVLDGNVMRVLSRLLADTTNIASTTGKKHFTAIAQRLLDHDHPSQFNQAMMELGATICLPKSPQCLLCPVAFCCQAREQNLTNQLPVKITDKKSKKINRTLYWIEQNNAVLAWQRPPNSRLMPGFWELPESDQLPNAQTHQTFGTFRHGITIHSYTFTLLTAAPPADINKCQWLQLDQLQTTPLSTIFRKALRLIPEKPKQQATGA